MSLTPKGFHHHSPNMHLAFICGDPTARGRGNRYTVLKVRGDNYELAMLAAVNECEKANVPKDWLMTFLGHVA